MAGADLASAFALLRCGTPADFDRDPDQRLRLTIGLRQLDDRCVVTHEHHSFADTTGSPDAPDATDAPDRALRTSHLRVSAGPGQCLNNSYQTRRQGAPEVGGHGDKRRAPPSRAGVSGADIG
jgi:hypothetical protein